MVPYFEQPSVSIGPVTIHAFGAIVATALVVGDALYRRRVRSLGLDASVASGVSWYALVAGFLFAHFFSLFFYFPGKVVRDPWSVLKVWEDVSSFGGMVGGAAGAYVFFRIKGAHLSRVERWAYADAAAFVLPFAWAVGRIACLVAHDHPGRITRFPLAVSLATPEAQRYIIREYAAGGSRIPQASLAGGYGFHDLGWYEFLLLAFVVAPIFYILDRSGYAARRGSGFWVGLFATVYGVMRFFLDTLRVADARYLGLTPGQYMAIAMFIVGVVGLIYSPPRFAEISGETHPTTHTRR